VGWRSATPADVDTFSGGDEIHVVAVPMASIAGAAWNTIADLGERLVHEITGFMASYTRREGRTFTLRGTAERAAALQLIRAAQQ